MLWFAWYQWGWQNNNFQVNMATILMVRMVLIMMTTAIRIMMLIMIKTMLRMDHAIADR